MIVNRARLNPKVDLAFKKLFGVEANKDLLLSLINAVLDRKGKNEIVDISIQNPYNLADFKDGKLSIVDVKALDGNGEWYYVEMQVNPYFGFEKRILFYWSRVLVDQIDRGEEYSALRKVIGIHLLDFDCLPGNEMHQVYRLRENESGHVLTDMLEFHFLELRKFRKDFSEIATALDRWISFMNHVRELDAKHLPETMRVPEIEKALSILDKMSMTREELQMYESHVDVLAVQRGEIEYARQESLAKMLPEGEERKEERREERREERSAKLRVSWKVSFRRADGSLSRCCRRAWIRRRFRSSPALLRKR